ncbi:MAG: stress response protein [Gammaproteobacteria bacterium]|nr:MAG: stress response protein [Gammaproteobacteria bacterium]
MKIERDHARFREIVRGRIRKELRKYITRVELVGRQGEKIISIPVPSIDLPHFQFGDNKGGVGQGEGEPGEGVPGDGGQGEAGDAPGSHALEVEVPLEELAKMLGEELELPNIEPRGARAITSQRNRYKSIRRTGPDSLRHFKRTYKKALRRQIASGTYDRNRPVIIPVREDEHFRSWNTTEEPRSNAAIVYMMDVSGSMGDEQKEIVRIEAFWIDTWLKSQYKHIERRFVVHDAAAREVDENTFYHLRESGGTKISSAYELCRRMMDENYPPDEWNVYPFHFSDGDNWGGGDTELCLQLLKDHILPRSNQFSYGQVESPYGSGQFIKDLETAFEGEDTMVVSRIDGKDGIPDSIKTFLGKGR